MNFLSHFYFDRDNRDCYFLLGTVLPDLLKNADKTIVLHPEKLRHHNGAVNSIIAGWRKHLAVDRHFHSSEFFVTHSHHLKKALLPALVTSPVKPFFLGHVALELILDNLLLTTGKVTVDGFYDHLRSCSESNIEEFLHFAGLSDTKIFFTFFEKFKKERYLQTYADTTHVAYALKRVCMRIWPDPFTADQEMQIDDVIIAYRQLIFPFFMTIFDQIDAQLASVRE